MQRASEVVLQCELRDAGTCPIFTGDGTEGGAAADRVGGAWVIQDGMVQHIEILCPEFQLGFTINREGACKRGIPNSEAGAAERIFDHIPETSSGAGIGGNGKGRRVQPAFADFTCSTVTAPICVVKVTGLSEVPLGAVLRQTR